MSEYKVLNKQVFQSGEFSLVPIRFEDRYNIMQWRNEQIYHLRQNKPLTKEDQDAYFENVVSKLFNQEHPNQLLFSFLEKDVCIGYGGLVHIDWKSYHAEISILLNTELNIKNYKNLVLTFFNLIEQVGYELKINKIYTFGYDFDDARFEPLYKSGFILDAFLHEHVVVNQKLVPVRIYSKILIK
jgi:RimJ/RimL family protein N-acetyltransferase